LDFNLQKDQEGEKLKVLINTYLLGQGYPVAASAMLLDVCLESGIFLGRPWSFLDVGFVTARSSPHVFFFVYR
jgi:hypothetical protein